MDLLWIVYWSLLLISLIFSIYILIKKNKLVGIIQGSLTIGYLLSSSLYVLLNRDYTTGISEIDFIVSSLLNKELGAICVVLLLLILIIIFVYNLFEFTTKRNK